MKHFQVVTMRGRDREVLNRQVLQYYHLVCLHLHISTLFYITGVIVLMHASNKHISRALTTFPPHAEERSLRVCLLLGCEYMMVT